MEVKLQGFLTNVSNWFKFHTSAALASGEAEKFRATSKCETRTYNPNPSSNPVVIQLQRTSFKAAES
jgi:hypothetical protein